MLPLGIKILQLPKKAWIYIIFGMCVETRDLTSQISVKRNFVANEIW